MLAQKRHKKTVTYQLFEDQVEVLQRISADTGLSQAEVLRQFVDQGVEAYEMERVKRRGRGGRLG